VSCCHCWLAPSHKGRFYAPTAFGTSPSLLFRQRNPVMGLHQPAAVAAAPGITNRLRCVAVGIVWHEDILSCRPLVWCRSVAPPVTPVVSQSGYLPASCVPSASSASVLEGFCPRGLAFTLGLPLFCTLLVGVHKPVRHPYYKGYRASLLWDLLRLRCRLCLCPRCPCCRLPALALLSVPLAASQCLLRRRHPRATITFSLAVAPRVAGG
jgi:hypothetical protein